MKKLILLTFLGSTLTGCTFLMHPNHQDYTGVDYATLRIADKNNPYTLKTYVKNENCYDPTGVVRLNYLPEKSYKKGQVEILELKIKPNEFYALSERIDNSTSNTYGSITKMNSFIPEPGGLYAREGTIIMDLKNNKPADTWSLKQRCRNIVFDYK